MLRPTIKQIDEFSETSSQIEGEYSQIAITDHRLAFECAQTFQKMDLQSILEIHQVLMMSIRPDIAGKIRDCPVWVGGRMCPLPVEIPIMLRNWIKKYSGANFRGKKGKQLEEAIQKSHVEFEKIHPFEDGNGRTGRIILNWHRMMNGLPILIIHPGVEQMEYYTWFKE